MFGNRKDPMIDTVQKVMDENARRRQIEADLNEELGIQDRKQLGHEKHDLYDQALSQRINEAVLSPKQKSLAAIGGNPKKIDAPDLAKLRAMKNEAKDVEANEEPPFEPDVKKSTPWKNPQSKAKNMAREMMKKMKAKQDIKEEEQTDKTGKNKKASHDWASDPRVAKAIKYQINQSGKQREKELKEEEQIDKLTNEDLSLESIQEEIRNNLLERANHLLEHGSQEQIVEFMNDLTMEQRSILNMQEDWTNYLPTPENIKSAGGLGALVGKGVTRVVQKIGSGLSDINQATMSDTERAARTAAKPAAPAPAAKPAAAAPVVAAAQPAPAAKPTPSSVSTADTGGDKYGSGNASAGFERGKYAAPSSSDNSSASNELRSKQAAADRGNLEESKSKYIPESITFERFLRNR